MAKEMTRDMTVGSPMKLILGFSIPLLLGSLFQQFYNVVDTVIVGRFLGMQALAGVGATGSINFMIVGFCMGICSGFAIPVAHKFGAKDYSGMRQVIANCVWLSIAFALVITVSVSLLCGKILAWMNTPEDIFQNAYSYILIIFLGIPASFLYNILSGIIRSMEFRRVLFRSGISYAVFCYEHRAGSGMYPGLPHGSGRRGGGNRDFPARFRSVMSGLYDQEV